MPSTLNLMTTGAVAEKYGISVTSVNYAIRGDKVRAFTVDSGTGRSLFLIDPESAEQRWGAKTESKDAPPPAAESACVVRRSDSGDSTHETLTLARVSQDASILDSGGIVLFQDANTPDRVAVHASHNIGALLLNASINAPSVRPLFIQVSETPQAAYDRLLALLEPYRDDVQGGYSTEGVVQAIYEFGKKD